MHKEAFSASWLNSEGLLDNKILHSSPASSISSTQDNTTCEMLEATMNLYKSQYYSPETHLRVVNDAERSQFIVLLKHQVPSLNLTWDVIHCLPCTSAQKTHDQEALDSSAPTLECHSWLGVEVNEEEEDADSKKENSFKVKLSFQLQKCSLLASSQEATTPLELLGMKMEEHESAFRSEFFDIFIPRIKAKVAFMRVNSNGSEGMSGGVEKPQRLMKSEMMADLMKVVQARKVVK